MSDYSCNRFLQETSTHSVDKNLINFSEEEKCSLQKLCQIEGLVSFLFSSRFQVCFHFFYCSTYSAIEETAPSYRHLSPQPCMARLPTMFLNPQFYFFSFSLLFFFLFTCSLIAPGGGIIFRRRFISEHPIDSSLSFPSPFQVRHAPVTLLDSVTFSENQSLPTPFRI